MSYVDYSALIQLAVVFNFAFIYEELEPVKLFKKLFSNIKSKIISSDKEIESGIILLEQSIHTISLENNSKEALKSKLNRLHQVVDLERINIEVRLNLSPVYFQTACLMLAVYSVCLLFFMADSKSHLLSMQAWPIFTLTITFGILYYLTKEIFCFFNFIDRATMKPVLRIVVFVLFSFLLSYALAYAYNTPNIHSLFSESEVRNEIVNGIRYYSLFLPFASFIICFVLHTFSIVYAVFKIFIIEMRMNRQRGKQNQILEREKNDIRLNF